MDSIMRGYPVGIVLVWETYKDIQYRQFEKIYRNGTRPAFIDNSSKKKLKLVLDGQQRLQSLYLARRVVSNNVGCLLLYYHFIVFCCFHIITLTFLELFLLLHPPVPCLGLFFPSSPPPLNSVNRFSIRLALRVSVSL